MVYREKNSLNSLGQALPAKVAHRGAATVSVSQGNHSVKGLGILNSVEGSIEILHFPIRGSKQIENKISLGGAAYARNRELAESDGRTWREQYHDDRRLEARMNAGEIFIDTKLRDFFNAR